MNTKNYDVIIIGGGAGGLFLASQLPTALKVAIVESNDRVGKNCLRRATASAILPTSI